eukprot:8558023-Pyramimonas_sp.AAC.1
MARKCTSPYFGRVWSNVKKLKRVCVMVSRWKIPQQTNRISGTLQNAQPGTGRRWRTWRYLPATFLFEFQPKTRIFPTGTLW